MILPDLAYYIEMNKRDKLHKLLLIFTLCMLMLLTAGCQQKENGSKPVSQQLYHGKVFASDEDFAYFTAGNALFKWEKGSEQVEKLSDTFSADFMQLYGNSLYYTIYLTGELRVYDLKTGEDIFLGQMWDTPSADYNGPFWIDEDKIYCLSYTESGQPAVQVLSLEGTPEQAILFAHQTPFPFWVEDRTLYYAARLDNREHWQTFELNLDTGETSSLQLEGHCNILGEKDGRLAIVIRSEGHFFLDADGKMEPVEEGYSFAQVNDSAEYYWRHELMGSVLCRKQEGQMQDIAWFDNYCPNAVLEDGFLYIQRLSNLELYDIELVNAAQLPDDVLSEILEYRHTKMRDYTVSLAVSPDGILYLLDANIYS